MVDPSTIRILYIEDNNLLCKLFKAAIEAHGYNVDTIDNGAAGLALQAKQPYDLLAIDHQLPDMLGLDVARQLLVNDPDVAIIMVTGEGSEQVAADALALGVYNYVIKGSENT